MNSASDNSNTDRRDRLFGLLPQVLRMSDAATGGALQALLRIMTVQADIVEDDIAALLDNWFIETCDDWVTPYLAELVGYKVVFDAATFGDVQTERDYERVRILAPRPEAANTVRYRRRKGTLLVLEEITKAASGWPTRAVECLANTAVAWRAGRPNPLKGRVSGRTLNLHSPAVVDSAGGPFDVTWRLTDLRRLASTLTPGLGSPYGILLWAWRLKSYAVGKGEAYSHCADGVYRRFSFDPFGLDMPLFTQPQPLPRPTQPAGKLQVPAPISRHTLRNHLSNYYGADRSIFLWRGQSDWPVLLANIVVADLARWHCPLASGQVAVDPRLGRILTRWDDAERDALVAANGGNATAFDDDEPDLWVRYCYGFSADMGGGSYRRTLQPVQDPVQLWLVARNLTPDPQKHQYVELSDALEDWKNLARPRRVCIEIQDDSTYGLGLHDRHKRRTMHLKSDESLEIRAGQGRRPAIVPGEPNCTGYEWRFGSKNDKHAPDRGGIVALDGLRIADVTVVLAESISRVHLRHTTLTPGRADLRFHNFSGDVSVDRCIVGAVESEHVHDGSLAPRLTIRDSILDGTCKPAFSLVGAANQAAYVRLRCVRTTFFGAVQAYEIDLAADSIFADALVSVLWDRGLLRYCSISTATALTSPSPTPPRYGCQPDCAVADLPPRASRDPEKRRVVPHFRSRRYGDPSYAQLSPTCPVEIVRGAEDGSEPGAFHDLYQPQRETLLLARLREYTLAQADARLVYAT